jgi:hypothetical protein
LGPDSAQALESVPAWEQASESELESELASELESVRGSVLVSGSGQDFARPLAVGCYRRRRHLHRRMQSRALRMQLHTQSQPISIDRCSRLESVADHRISMSSRRLSSTNSPAVEREALATKYARNLHARSSV